MRSAPYQARARALAVAAGLDPEAKINRPGQRPMPTWCTFRDAARKEPSGDRARGRCRCPAAPGGAIPVREDRRGDQEIRDHLDYLDANARPARLLAR